MPHRMGELGLSEPGPARARLALLWILPVTLSGLLGVAWGASSLGAPHIHHFHGSSSKHPSVPIAIYRSPASLRGGHGGFGGGARRGAQRRILDSPACPGGADEKSAIRTGVLAEGQLN